MCLKIGKFMLKALLFRRWWVCLILYRKVQIVLTSAMSFLFVRPIRDLGQSFWLRQSSRNANVCQSVCQFSTSCKVLSIHIFLALWLIGAISGAFAWPLRLPHVLWPWISIRVKHWDKLPLIMEKRPPLLHAWPFHQIIFVFKHNYQFLTGLKSKVVDQENHESLK